MAVAMFRPKYLNLIVVLVLLMGMGLSAWTLASVKSVNKQYFSQKQEPVLPLTWSEPVWPSAGKLGHNPPATVLIAVPDLLARNPRNMDLVQRLNASFPDRQLLGLNLEQTISEIGKAAGVSIVVDWDELAKQGIKRDSPLTGSSYQSVNLDGVLNEVFKRVYGVEGKLGYDICAGIIRVTTKDALDRRNLFIRSYNVADLIVARDKIEAQINETLKLPHPTSMNADSMKARMEELVKIIQNCVLKDSWQSAGGPANVEHFGYMLIITQTPEGHAHVERLLEQLRSIMRGN